MGTAVRSRLWSERDMKTTLYGEPSQITRNSADAPRQGPTACHQVDWHGARGSSLYCVPARLPSSNHNAETDSGRSGKLENAV